MKISILILLSLLKSISLLNFEVEDILKQCDCVEYQHLSCNYEIYVPTTLIYDCELHNGNMRLDVSKLESYSSVLIEEIEESITHVYGFNNIVEFLPTQFLHLHNLINFTFTNGNLIAAPFDQFEYLKNLEHLDFSHNKIIDIHNSGNFILSYMNFLNMSYNSIKHITEDFLVHFPNLKVLSLSNNEIESIENNGLHKLDELTYLDLSYNKIEDINYKLSKLHKLSELHLDYNEIKFINEFDLNFNKIEVLTISNNNIKDIKSNSFTMLTDLIFVDLSHNYIESIETKLFDNSKKLTHLDVSHNNIKFIQVNCFENNKFTNFYIEGNKLEIPLQKGIFQGLTSVKMIDLNHQNIGSIEDMAFCGTPLVEKLNISFNNLALLSMESFKCLKNLKVLDLGNNILYRFSINSEDIKNLQWISLRNNKINFVSNDIFDSLTNLTFLDLSTNHLVEIPDYTFKNLSNLNELLLNNNKLISYSFKSFKGLSNLLILDISCNFVSELKNLTFNDMYNIQKINISNNQIIDLEYNAFIGLQKMEIIDLSFNRLTSFFVNTTELKYLTTIILSNNLINSISHSTMLPLQNLLKLLLHNNKLDTLDSNVISANKFISFASLSFNKSKNILVNYSMFVNNRDLIGIDLSGIIGINVSGNVSIFSIKHLKVIDSNINDIQSLQLKSLNKLNEIILSNNKFEKVEKDNFVSQYNVLNIDLSYNEISSIQPGSFRDNKQLLSLDLSHNKIYDLHYGTFNGLSELKVLDLSHNLLSKFMFIPIVKQSGRLEQLFVDNNIISETDIATLSRSLINPIIISIGNNSIPCKLLFSHESDIINFTSRNLDYHSENVEGVTCQSDTDINRDSFDKNDIVSELIPTFQKLAADINNLTLELHNQMIYKDDLERKVEEVVNKSNINTDNITENAPINKTKHHSISHLYESIRNENVDILKQIQGVTDEWIKATKAIIFLSVILGIIISFTFAYLVMRYVSFRELCHRYRTSRYIQEDSVELET